DGDGIGDNSDLDRDGDGVPNDSDALPEDASRSTLPTITIDSPANLATVGSTPISVSGTLEGDPVSLIVDGVQLTHSTSSFQASFSLEEGHNTITARMVDDNGLISTASVEVSLDLTSPLPHSGLPQ